MPYPSTIKLYQFSGKDVLGFLQGQCTADITKIKNGTFQLTGICNAKGRLVASPFILLFDETYYLALDDIMVDTLFSYWKPFLMLSRIQTAAIALTDQSQAFTALVDNLTLQSTFENCLKTGLVLITPQTSKCWMPLALHYDTLGALSFQKGCYVGQEILARVHYKGKVTKKIMHAQFKTAIACEPGSCLTDLENNVIGTIATAPRHEATYQALMVCSTTIDAQSIQLKLDAQMVETILQDQVI